MDPTKLELHRRWDSFIKFNSNDWEIEHFKNVFTICTVADMWGLLNNIPDSCTGKVNLFFMEKGLVPLWEHHKDIFSNGGCWSTIVKHKQWKVSMNDICMSVLGEALFDENDVKGICIVPVSMTHCIIKIWVTTHSDINGKLLKSCLADCCEPRFKRFS